MYRADLCTLVPGDSQLEQGTASSSSGNCCAPSVAGRPQHPSYSSQETAHGVQGPSPCALRCMQAPLTGNPSSQRPNPFARFSSPQHARELQAEHPTATLTHTVSTARGGRGATAPTPRLLTPGSHGRPWWGMRAGAAGQERGAPVPAGHTHLLSAVPGLGGQGRARQGRAVRSLPSRRIIAPPWPPPAAPLRASPRAAEPPPVPPRPARTGPEPPPGRRHRLRQRPDTAVLPRGTAAPSPPGCGDARPEPREPRPARPLPSLPAAEGPAARPVPPAVGRWHGGAAERARPGPVPSGLRRLLLRAAPAPSPGRQRRRQGKKGAEGRRQAPQPRGLCLPLLCFIDRNRQQQVKLTRFPSPCSRPRCNGSDAESLPLLPWSSSRSLSAVLPAPDTHHPQPCALSLPSKRH